MPGDACFGTTRCTVTVFDPFNQGEAAFTSLPVDFQTTFHAMDALELNVFAVLVHYAGLGPQDPRTGQRQNIDLPAPLRQDFFDALTFTQKVYPIWRVDYRGFAEIEFSGDLFSTPDAGWDELVRRIGMMQSESGTDDVYLGLLPQGVPIRVWAGMAGGGRAAASVAVPGSTAVAHEIGYTLGRMHAPSSSCNQRPGGVDPNYPTWGGKYPSDSSIGEFGFDIDNTSQATLLVRAPSPLTHADFMAYCYPQWISPYTFENLQSHIFISQQEEKRLRPAEGGIWDRPEKLREPGEYLHLNFRIYRDDRVELLPSYHLYGPAPVSVTAPSFPVSFELRGAEGQALEFHRCRLGNIHQDPEGPYLEFKEAVPWHRDAQSIAFFRHGTEVYTYEVEEHAPDVNVQTPEPVREGREEVEAMRLSWRAEHPEDPEDNRPITYLIRYSTDEGKSWTALDANLSLTERVFDLNALPGGESSVFQVIASAGIRTAVAETDPFSVPREPRQAYILSRTREGTFAEGEPIVLVGEGVSSDFGTTVLEDMVWSSHKDGHLGVGREVITNTLSAGEHRITLSVPDGLGGESSATTRIEVTRATLPTDTPSQMG
jgi:hypothetical protein